MPVLLAQEGLNTSFLSEWRVLQQMSHECGLATDTSLGLRSVVTCSIDVLSKWILDDAFFSLLGAALVSPGLLFCHPSFS